MPWPTPQDYNEAIQNPRANFQEAELREGRPELTALGLPRPITGNFASVYRLQNRSGNVAVRCFFREFPDMRARYAAISSHLGAVGLEYTVGFAYLDEGIRVRASRYPVLKMDWVHGRLLDEFLRENLHNPTKIVKLARNWRSMAGTLYEASVAHGDLQHGNVMIVNGSIKLVDYDGMYVPGLRGKHSLEVGHPNYQHPARDGELFGPATDNFSHWVIYASLTAIGVDPNLWHELGAGDERLLFSRSDFENPSSSPAFRRLTVHTHPEIRGSALFLRSLLDLQPDSIPPLQTQMQPTPAHGRYSRRRMPRATGGIAVSTASTLPEWVTPHVASSPLKALAPPGRLPRVVLGGSLLATLSQAIPAIAVLSAPEQGVMAGSLLLVNLSMLGGSFLSNAAAREKLSLIRRRHQHSIAAGRIEHKMTRLERRSDRLDRSADAVATTLQCRAASANTAAGHRREKIEKLVRSALAELSDAEMALKQDRLAEIDSRLERARQTHVTKLLQGTRLRSANIPGLAWTAKARLWVAGVRSAADVGNNHAQVLTALGARDAAKIISWRAAESRSANRSTPIKLDSGTMKRIEERYDRLQSVEALRKQVVLDATPVLSALKGLNEAKEAELFDQLVNVSRQQAFDESLLGKSRSTLTLRYADLTRHLDAIEAELEGYNEITFRRYVIAALLPWNHRRAVRA